MLRKLSRIIPVLMVVGLLAAALSASPALAAKGGKHSATLTTTLTATPNTLHAGEYFTVSGCGFNTALGNVIVGFTGGSWGSPLDANGCFSIPNIPALSGDTLPPGVYKVSAYQYVRDKLTVTGETSVTIVP